MQDLKEIGFYTLSNERAQHASATSQMKRCELIITEHCNFACEYCRGLRPDIYSDRITKTMTFDEIAHTIDLWCDEAAGPLENIRFSGGEPTLHVDIKAIVAYAKGKGIKRIAISTNGSNRTSLYKELIELGVNDYSISLDACCAEDGDRMAGNRPGVYNRIALNIQELSKLTYVSVGIVLVPETVENTIDIIKAAAKLGVSDIRVIPAAQWDQPIPQLAQVPQSLLDRYPILKFRVQQFLEGKHVRGMLDTDQRKCAIVLDDSVVAGKYHFPCVIYMREQGDPIGKVRPLMREEREEWFNSHDCRKDPICTKNCLDVCRNYNETYAHFHPEV